MSLTITHILTFSGTLLLHIDSRFLHTFSFYPKNFNNSHVIGILISNPLSLSEYIIFSLNVFNNMKICLWSNKNSYTVHVSIFGACFNVTEGCAWQAFSAETMGEVVNRGRWMEEKGTGLVWISMRPTLRAPSDQ